MKDFQGRTAFITGGAGGFGQALARRLLDDGMRVMLADIEQTALDAAAAALADAGGELHTTVCDVTDRASMLAAAAHVQSTFGAVHLLCNNAGVLAAGPIDRVRAQDWDWIHAVNVKGLVNGVAAFLPGMRAHGETAHVLNVASIAGLIAFPGDGAYCSTKFAAIALSEALRGEVAGSAIGVTVLCPGFMKTDFFGSGRRRPARFGPQQDLWATVDPAHRALLEAEMAAGVPPDEVARIAIQGIREDRFVVVTHMEHRDMIAARHEQIIAAYDWLADMRWQAAPA